MPPSDNIRPAWHGVGRLRCSGEIPRGCDQLTRRNFKVRTLDSLFLVCNNVTGYLFLSQRLDNIDY